MTSARWDVAIPVPLFTNGRTSFRKISRSLKAARFGFRFFQSLWNLTGTPTAALPRCLSTFWAIRSLQNPILRLRDLARFGGKTFVHLMTIEALTIRTIINIFIRHGSIPVWTRATLYRENFQWNWGKNKMESLLNMNPRLKIIHEIGPRQFLFAVKP